MSDQLPNPPPPDCITEVLYRNLGPIETDHEERRIDELAQAVWDALLAEGRIHAPNDDSVTRWSPYLEIPLKKRA